MIKIVLIFSREKTINKCGTKKEGFSFVSFK